MRKNLFGMCNLVTGNGAYLYEGSGHLCVKDEYSRDFCPKMKRKEKKAVDDERIVELYLLRDEAAIRQSAGKFGMRLRALSYGIVGDRQTAEECENDTYLEAWNRIPPHEPRSYLYPFLARIDRHISLNCCRDRSRLKRSALICELSAEMEQCIPAPDDVECRIDDLAFAEAINGFLASLG